MTVLVSVAATLAAVIHVVIFYMESVAWLRPSVWKRFGLTSQDEAKATAKLAYNQGFYNLFLAIGALLGTILYGTGVTGAGFGIALFSLGSMLAASVILITTGRGFIRAAVFQGLLPLIAVILLLLSLSEVGLA